MAAFSDLTFRLGANISEYTTAINDAVKQAEKGAREIEKQFKGLSKIGASLADVGKSLTLGLTTPILGLGAVAVNSAAKLESLEMGLTAVTGSAEETARQMIRLKEVAKLPGLGLEEAVQGSVALQAVGVESIKAERYIKGFGNALAVVGKGRAELQGVVTQLVQMSAKSKVTADDLKPLMQAVPQLATIVKSQFGTIDTETLQKMGVGTQQFLDVILTGLERLPKAGGGVGNAIENVKDSLTQTMAEIGKGLKPAVAPALDALDSLLNKLKDVAEGFQKLPAPAQAAIGAFAGLAVTTGPVLFSFGKLLQMGPGIAATIAKIAGTFGTSSLGLLGWSAAIAVVVAALAALGTWVYQNWEPIKATLTQAWAGLSELWGYAWGKITSTVTGIWNGYVGILTTVWGPIIKFFQSVWSGVAPYFTAVWTSISTFLTGIWTSVSNIATKLWDGIKAKFTAFLNWARTSVPGAAKLLSLDETWNKEQAKLASSASTPTASTPTTSGAPKTAPVVNTKAVEKLRDLMADVAKKGREAFEAWRNPEATETAKRLVELDAKIADLKREGIAISDKEVANLKAQVREAGFYDKLLENRKKVIKDAHDRLEKGIAVLQKENELLIEQDKVRRELKQRIEDQVSAVEAQATSARLDAEKKTLDDEKTLALANADAVNATTLKEKLAVNSQKLQIEIDYLKKSEALELLKIERVREAALNALRFQRAFASEEDQAVLDSQIDRVNRAYDQIANGIKDAYKRTSEITVAESKKTATQITNDQKKLSNEISTVLTTMNQSIADSIVHWNGFGATAVSVVQSIGKAIISHLIGSLLLTEDRMKAVSNSIAGIFTASKAATKAADVSTQATQIAKVGTDAAQTAQKTASTAIKSVSSTVMGAIGAVGSVVGAISSVIGNFQMHGMNKALDKIVLHTLQTANDLANLRADEWLREDHLLKKLDSIWQTIMVKSDMIAQAIVGGGAVVAGGAGLTININNPSFRSEADVTAMTDAMVRELKLRGIIR